MQQGYRTIIASRAMLSSTPDTARDLFSRFGPEPLNAVPKLGAKPDVDKLLAMAGDAERGRKVYLEVGGGLCSKSHIVADKGLDFGPNLSQIGVKYNRADMLDNILHPSKTIAQGYETYVVPHEIQSVIHWIPDLQNRRPNRSERPGAKARDDQGR